ncbi:hypothetical protein Ancab_014800 [Ancistrocladus abbreviatus]
MGSTRLLLALYLGLAKAIANTFLFMATWSDKLLTNSERKGSSVVATIDSKIVSAIVLSGNCAALREGVPGGLCSDSLLMPYGNGRTLTFLIGGNILIKLQGYFISGGHFPACKKAICKGSRSATLVGHVYLLTFSSEWAFNLNLSGAVNLGKKASVGGLLWDSQGWWIHGFQDVEVESNSQLSIKLIASECSLG